MDEPQPVIWIYADAAGRDLARPLVEALAGWAACLTLGPAGQPEPELVLEEPDGLAAALEACPPGLRPGACAWVASPGAPALAGLEGLPCPALGWGPGAVGPEGVLPAQPQAAAQALLEAARAGLNPPWLKAVQLNMPLTALLGRFQELVASLPFNLEIGIDFNALDSLGPADLALARQATLGRRITTHLPFGDLVPGSPDPRVAAVARQRLDLAGRWALELRAEQAVMHLGYDQRMHPDPDLYAQNLAQVLGPTVTALNQGGCRLALECVFEPGPRPLLAARQALLRAGATQVGFCLDVGHAQVFSATDLPRWWEALAPHLFEMHLHDNDGRRDQHLPPGQGGVDWAFLRASLAGLAPRPILTLEPHCEPDLWASLRALHRLWGPPGD